MRTTVILGEALLKEAKEHTGITERSRRAVRRLADLGGRAPDIRPASLVRRGRRA